jgi:hypothetical protein
VAKDITRKKTILMILAILIAAQAAYTAPVDLEKIAAMLRRWTEILGIIAVKIRWQLKRKKHEIIPGI